MPQDSEEQAEVTPESQETPEPEVSFSSILESQKTPEENEEKEEVKPEQGEEEESEPDDEEKAEEPSEDEEDLDIPQLDPELAKDPKLVKRWEQQWTGLLKREEAVKGNEDVMNVFKSYNDAFQDPAEYEKAYTFLGEQLAKLHGASKPAVHKTAEYSDPSRWMDGGYSSEVEYRLDIALQKQEQELAALRAEIGPIKAERARAAQQAEFTKYVDDISPRAIKQIEKEHLGFKVTNQMVRQAISEFPQFTDKPVAAIEAKYSKALMKHYAESATKGTKRVRDMTPSGSPKAISLPKDLSNLTFQQVAEMRNQSGQT